MMSLTHAWLDVTLAYLGGSDMSRKKLRNMRTAGAWLTTVPGPCSMAFESEPDIIRRR